MISCFGPSEAAVELNDVAEVAPESAADGGLHHHRPIIADVDQIPARERHIAKLLENGMTETVLESLVAGSVFVDGNPPYSTVPRWNS